MRGLTLGPQATVHSLARALTCTLVLAQASGAAAQGTPPATPTARRGHRVVEVRWDLAIVEPLSALEIWIDCSRASPDALDECGAPGERIAGAAAYAFELKDSDRVLLIVHGSVAGDNQRLDAQYAITGVNVDDVARQQLSKLFAPFAPAANAFGAAPGPPGVRVTAIVAVSDRLLAGGRLAVTFRELQTIAGKDALVTTTSPIVFRVASRPPWFALSFGLGVTRAPNPAVQIVRTSTVVPFVKDGRPQQAYQAAIHLKDAIPSLRPLDTAVAFMNFRVAGPAYVSLGLPADESVFSQPLLGGSLRIPAGTLGLLFTAGVHFTRETRIVAASGFADGQLLDPTAGLTVGEIPVEAEAHRRFFFAFSVDY
jgi:hypothetical protein